MSKFCEPDVQAVVEHNRNIFEPDSDAVTEVLEMIRNNDLSTLHLYDTINDQENEDLQSETQDNSNDKESFNNRPSEHLGSQNSPDDQSPGGSITAYNQPIDISDDHLRESVRSLNAQQPDAYNIVLSWCRNKVKNMNSLKPVDIKPIYLFIQQEVPVPANHTLLKQYAILLQRLSDME